MDKQENVVGQPDPNVVRIINENGTALLVDVADLEKDKIEISPPDPSIVDNATEPIKTQQVLQNRILNALGHSAQSVLVFSRSCDTKSYVDSTNGQYVKEMLGGIIVKGTKEHVEKLLSVLRKDGKIIGSAGWS